MLKTLAREQTKTTVIARKLKRSVAAVYLRASKLGVMLGVNGCQNPRKDGAAKKGRARLARIGTKYGDGCRLGEDWRSRWILFR